MSSLKQRRQENEMESPSSLAMTKASYREYREPIQMYVEAVEDGLIEIHRHSCLNDDYREAQGEPYSFSRLEGEAYSVAKHLLNIIRYAKCPHCLQPYASVHHGGLPFPDDSGYQHVLRALTKMAVTELVEQATRRSDANAMDCLTEIAKELEGMGVES